VTETHEQPDDANRSDITLANFIEGISGAFAQFAIAVGGLMQLMAPAIQQIYAGMEARYKEEGSPYGETHEGMMQWTQAIGEDCQKQREAGHIAMYDEAFRGAQSLAEKMLERMKEEEETVKTVQEAI
jgi:hypothetical protein